MIFNLDQIIRLPELAGHLGLTSQEFRVDQILKGGMGECIRIVQGENSYALKVIQRDFVDHSNSWDRYLREVRLWVTLSACEGVAEALCIIRVNEFPVVCSQWMEGGNLRSHLGNRSPELFFSVMARVVGTLAWAHQQHKVIHRDLKPDNILLDAANLAFVSDWGLARPLTVAMPEAQGRRSTMVPGVAHPSLTEAGSFLGTVFYASPEQLLGDMDLDHRTDIYSLGCLMYEWEAGRCPFIGMTGDEVRLKHLFERPAPLGSVFKKTTFGVEGLIRDCLEKDPRKRLSDYSSLNRSLLEAAKKRNIRYQEFLAGERYAMPMVGARAFRADIAGRGTKNTAGTHRVVEYVEIEQFIREALALTSVGDYSKAAEIYGSLFVPEMVTAVPDVPLNQHVAINYALCLIELGRAKEAISVLECLSAAEIKPAEYFIELSLALLMTGDYRSAATTAEHGLGLNPDDQNLVGNLLQAQTAMGEFAKAAETAKIRLVRKRDVHSRHEVAALHCKYADSIRELDWPLAVKNLKYAVGLLREAKDLNPRYLQVRIQLPIALEAMTAYDQCSAEIVATEELPLHVSDRAFLAYLFARCLDRLNDHTGCLKFCDSWLDQIAKVQATNPVPRHNVVKLERVRAVTIADGFAIGRMTDGKRVVVPNASEFFAHVVLDEKMREPSDFCYLARFHEWVEEYAEAEAILILAQSLYPEYWEIPFHRAVFRWRAQNPRGALDFAAQASQLAPWKSQTWDLLGKISDCLGRTVQAEEAKRRAAEVQRVRDELDSEIDRA